MKKDLRTIFSSFWLGGINFSSFSACNKPLRSPSGITQYFMVNLKTNLVLKKFRNVWKKKKSWSDLRTMAAWGVPWISHLEITINWTAIIQQNILSLVCKPFWEICASKYLKVSKWGKRGRMKGRGTAETDAMDTAWSCLQDLGRGEKLGLGEHAL